MKDLITLRDALAGVQVPSSVIGVDHNFGRWEVHMRESDFRKAFKVFNHLYHSRYKDSDAYRLEVISEGVRFYAITDEVPVDTYVDTRSRFAQIAAEEQEKALNDPVARARSNW